jgi:hypothetical protein
MRQGARGDDEGCPDSRHMSTVDATSILDVAALLPSVCKPAKSSSELGVERVDTMVVLMGIAGSRMVKGDWLIDMCDADLVETRSTGTQLTARYTDLRSTTDILGLAQDSPASPPSSPTSCDLRRTSTQVICSD